MGERGCLVAMEFLDKKNKSLLAVGCLVEDAKCSYHEVVLEEDERIVGIQTDTTINMTGQHKDVRLVIGRMIWS